MNENTGKKLYGALNADCLDAMKRMPDNSIDAIVTDPPYGINFMNKKWDSPGGMVGQMATGKEKRGGFAYGGSHSRGYKDCDLSQFQEYMTPLFQEMLRIAKPGAHLLAFGGTRTYHRLACAIEDAGWEIRDCVMWIYGQGFPKSMNVGLAIDKLLGQESIDTGVASSNARPNCGKSNTIYESGTVGKSFTIKKANNEWGGWGTCLKPAYEPVIMARKPLEGTVAKNVLKWGVGGLNIDECRVPYESDDDKASAKPQGKATSKVGALAGGVENDRDRTGFEVKETNGRFPANVIHDGSEEVVELFPESNGGAFPAKSNVPTGKHYEGGWGKVDNGTRKEMDSGTAARFFYCAKASKSEKGKDNIHPTVKPIELMKYLVKLVAPKGSLVLDPFMGSGSTGVAAIEIGRRFIGIEKEPEYFKIAENRLANAKPETSDVV